MMTVLGLELYFARASVWRLFFALAAYHGMRVRPWNTTSWAHLCAERV